MELIIHNICENNKCGMKWKNTWILHFGNILERKVHNHFEILFSEDILWILKVKKYVPGRLFHNDFFLCEFFIWKTLFAYKTPLFYSGTTKNCNLSISKNVIVQKKNAGRNPFWILLVTLPLHRVLTFQ